VTRTIKTKIGKTLKNKADWSLITYRNIKSSAEKNDADKKVEYRFNEIFGDSMITWIILSSLVMNLSFFVTKKSIMLIRIKNRKNPPKSRILDVERLNKPSFE
jgi:hypothetical protein